MRYAITLILTLLCLQLWAQDEVESDTIEEQGVTHAVQRRVEKDKVTLRWAPGNYSLFRHGAEHGYLIQRRAFTVNPEEEFSPETDIDGEFKTIKTAVPWTMEEWKANATDTSDIFAAVAAQILFGGEIDPKGQGEMESLQSYYEDQQRKYAYGVIAADLSRTASMGLGLRYEDTDVKPGHYYEYRVLFTSLPEGFEPDTAWTWADMKYPDEKRQVKHCFLEPSDKQITVYWTRHNDQFFTAYDVERSTDKVNWTKLNERPWMTSLYTPETPNFLIDSIDHNDKTYYYRIIGHTPFGDKGEYSEILSDKGVDQTPPAPAWGVQAEDMGGYVAVAWEAQPNEPDFDGFYVERSDAPNGNFEKISEKLPADAREFADLIPEPLSSNYYRVVSVDDKGNEAPSFSDLGYLVDSMPPGKPIGLVGTIDTLGRVELDWEPGPEADLIGYRVYWSNNKNAEYSQLIGEVIPGVNYVDSIAVKTLNEEIYYKIVAVDHRYNHSEYSDVLVLKKPDLVPPAAPLIYDYHVGEDFVEFKWHKSTSTDVVSQTLYRSEGADSSWSVVKKWSAEADSSFKDERVKSGESYRYKVVATDDAQHSSPSQVLRVTVADRGVKNTSITATFEVENNNATLQWVTSTSEKVKYVVFKTRGDEQIKLAGMFAPENTWLDANYSTGDQYTMRIIYPDGRESQLISFTQK